MQENVENTEEKTPSVKTQPKKPWRKRLRRVLLVGLCLALVAYAGWRFWCWAAVPADAPVIGASLDTAWHATVGISTKNYELALTRAGAKTLELRPDGGSPEQILDRIDGLLLTGGGDIDPELFGQSSQGAKLVDRERDDFELALIRGALERDMPILGICRGIQILNVLQGGTLRNLRDDPKAAKLHGIGAGSFRAHEVTISDDSRLARLLGVGPRQVNSFHGQAVGTLGEGLSVVAVTSDGLVEAVEMPQHAFVIATQWHPEIPPAEMTVFESFLEAAKAFRQTRSEAKP